MDEQIRSTIEGLDDDDFLELKELVDELYSKKQEEFEKKQAEKTMKEVRIGSNVIVNRGGKHIEALVVGMDMEKITFESEAYERKQSAKYSDIVKILD